MPYGNDDWLEAAGKQYAAAVLRVAKENDDLLRAKLKRDYKVPDEFMETAVRIWWDGKED